MARNLNIAENNLSVGQVKRITSGCGTRLDYVELLFSDRVKAQFSPKGNVLQFTISDRTLDMSDLNCLLDKDTLRNLIIAFKDSYNQILENESILVICQELFEKDFDMFFGKKGNFNRPSVCFTQN